MKNADPWTPAQATHFIREIAKSTKLAISYTKHAKERMAERGLIVSDALYVLKNGFVHDEPLPSTREGYCKYAIESRCPNSTRAVRIIVIPDSKSSYLKIITIMWANE